MHIDEALLKRIMKATGITSKTRAVDVALRELDRRAELIRLAQQGLGLTTEELKQAFNPDSDADAILHCAASRYPYGRKPHSR